MRILVQTPQRLVIEHKPRLACIITAVLGFLAVLGSLHDLLIARTPAGADNLIGLIMGMVCLIGAALLYRETTTTFDRQSGRVTWYQRGLTFARSESVRLERIRDVVIAASADSGASRVCLVLDERRLPLMFGFHGLGGTDRIRGEIRSFLNLS